MNCVECKSRIEIDHPTVIQKIKENPNFVIICRSCGCVYQYDDDMILCKVTREQIDQLLFDEPAEYHDIKKILAGIEEKQRLN